MDSTKIKNLLVGSGEERAVSPVIGVILMVAITVILAAVIAAFVLDIGDLDDSAPNAQYNWESGSDNQEVSWSHQSGDDVDLDNLEVSITANVTGGPDPTTGEETYKSVTLSGELGGNEFTAGDRVSFENEAGNTEIISVGVGTDLGLDYDDGDVDDDDDIYDIEEVVITWQSDSTSAIIAEYEP